jgi:hypothetical protein
MIGIEVDHTSLQERAEDMEQAIEKIREAEEAKTREELNYIG